MQRIPEQEIERLKRDVSIVDLVTADGVTLKKHGHDLIGLCPFHDDHEPSLVVSEEKNLWHCLGACRAGGSVIDWVMRRDGVTFRRAVLTLQGSESAPSTEPGSSGATKVEQLAPRSDDGAALAQVVEHYHRALLASAEGLGYLEQRGLRMPEAIEHFRIGLADRTLAASFPASTTDGRRAREVLRRVGVLRANGSEHLAGCLVIPIHDEHGQVVGLYGRRAEANPQGSATKHLYLPGPHRGVWNIEALQADKEIVLCEALLDALTFWCAGHRNVTTSYGVEGFTPELLAAFKHHGTERVLIAYDADPAGDRAAAELAERLTREGIACARVTFPTGMDANAYALGHDDADHGLGALLREALPMGASGIGRLAAESAPADEPPGTSLLAAPEPLPAPAPTPEEPPTPPRPHHGGVLAEVRGEEVHVQLGNRHYRVRGLHKNPTTEQLKVNLLVTHGDASHVDTVELYSARQRVAFVKQAADELGVREDVIKSDLRKLLGKLDELQREHIRRASEVQKPAMSPSEEKQALDLLRDPRLAERTLEDYERIGVIGERTNKLMGYLAAVSRMLEDPLAIIIQSSSAAGKSSLMDAILAFVPDEQRVQYSAMTGQSLFYMGETDLKRKVLAIVEGEGAERASYALKLLQSEGKLTIAATGKDPVTGRLVTHVYHVEGPVVLIITTTAIDIDEELMNRCIVLTVDEDREQTRAIHRQQRRRHTLEGMLARRERDALVKLHQNAQRLLAPLLVVNPYADDLTFPDDRTRTRRDHMKYLTLIDAITLWHQHQRARKTVVHNGENVPYIEVTPEDIALANELAGEVLGRSLDEMPPQTRRLLMLLEEMVQAACVSLGAERSEVRFTRREVREHTGYSYDQLRVHLQRLVDLEYVAAHRATRNQGYVYELLYDGKGKDGAPFLMNLLDVSKLSKRATQGGEDAGLGGEKARLGGLEGAFGGRLGAGWAPVGGRLGRDPMQRGPNNDAAPRRSSGKNAKNAYTGS